MKFKKKLLATLVAMSMSSFVLAQNLGFEDGTTTGWSGSGLTAVQSQTIQAGSYTWVVNPYGSYMGRIDILSGTSFSAMGTALGLSSASMTGIQNTLTTQAQSTGFGQGNITTAGWAYRTITLTAGETFSLAWQYISTDYVPFNDGSIASLVRVGSDTTFGVINNYTQQYALLGFTNPGTGDYSTGSYGATGWQKSTYSVTESGDYILGFGVFNLDDQALSPILFIDEQQGTTTLDGETFGAIAPNEGTLAPDESGGGSSGGDSGGDSGPVLVNDITGTVVSSDLDTAPTFNGGTLTMTSGEDVTNNFTITDNGGTIDANGTTSTISGVISNDGTDTNGTLTITDSQNTGGTVALSGTNTYTGPTVINYGAFLVLLNGNAITTSSSVTNNGGLNITGAGSSTVIGGNFTQGSTGGLIASLTATGATQLNVTGEVSLAGTYTLHANQGPYVYGKYTLITGNGITGEFDTFATNLDSFYGKYLKYSGTDVKLYVTPNATATQSSIDSVASGLGNAINLQASTAQNGLGNDCNTFGATGSCVSINLSQTTAAGGNLQSGGVTVGKRINDNWRFGVFTNSPFNSTSVGAIDVKSNTAYGGYVGWNKNVTGNGLGVTASIAQGNGSMKITRNGPEIGVGTSNTDTTAYQVRATYAVPMSETVTVTPYVGIRRTETSASGYTEQGPIFPLTVNATDQSSTDIIAGATVSKQLTDKLSANLSAGVVQRVSQTNAIFKGSSEIAGMSTFNGAVPTNSTTNPAFSAGVNYSVDKTTRVGVSAGIQQNGSNANITSVGVTLTKGF
jgi:hypothetical protein